MTSHLLNLAQAVAGMSILQASFFWLFIGVTVVAIKRIYTRFVLHKQEPDAPARHHNIAFVLAIAAMLALCLCFPFHVVQSDDQFDWIAACVVLYGTCWVSLGAVMSKDEEGKMLALIDEAQGAAPNRIEIATVKALVDASRFCRNGLIFVALGSVVQMGHLVYKAHPEAFFRTSPALHITSTAGNASATALAPVAIQHS